MDTIDARRRNTIVLQLMSFVVEDSEKNVHKLQC
jgi:hypothetical protein